MLRVIVGIALVIAWSSCKTKQETGNLESKTVYYLIRHGEKDRSDPTQENPILTHRGKERAQLWARYFDSISLDTVFSTDYWRTKQTAGPTATKKGLPITSYYPKKLVDDEFLWYTKGNRVLIVGHSNTTPMLVNQLLGEERFPDMDDSDNSSLYVVTFQGDEKHVEVRKVDLPQ